MIEETYQSLISARPNFNRNSNSHSSSIGAISMRKYLKKNKFI